MKARLLILLTFLFIIHISFAQKNNNLVVFCNEGENFTLILNGLKYNDVPATTVKVTSLKLASYKVKVIFENKKINDLNTTLTFYKTGKECVFGLMQKNKRKYSMDYVSATNIDEITPEDNQTKIITDNDNTTNTNTNTSDYSNTNTPDYSNTNTSDYSNPNNSNSISLRSGNLNIGVNENGGIKLGTKDGNINVNAKDKSGSLTIDNGQNGITLNKVARVGCATGMSSAQFETIKSNVSTQTTDSTKLITANVFFDNNCFLASQVKELMQLFSDDKAKLELAKKAYPYTHDLSNYYQLKAALSKEESKKDLQKFINNRKK